MASLCRNYVQIVYSQSWGTFSVPDAKVIEKLDRIYSCTQCKAVFLFKSDVGEHEETLGHGTMKELPLA